MVAETLNESERVPDGKQAYLVAEMLSKSLFEHSLQRIIKGYRII